MQNIGPYEEVLVGTCQITTRRSPVNQPNTQPPKNCARLISPNEPPGVLACRGWWEVVWQHSNSRAFSFAQRTVQWSTKCCRAYISSWTEYRWNANGCVKALFSVGALSIRRFYYWYSNELGILQVLQRLQRLEDRSWWFFSGWFTWIGKLHFGVRTQVNHSAERLERDMWQKSRAFWGTSRRMGLWLWTVRGVW